MSYHTRSVAYTIEITGAIYGSHMHGNSYIQETLAIESWCLIVFASRLSLGLVLSEKRQQYCRDTKNILLFILLMVNELLIQTAYD